MPHAFEDSSIVIDADCCFEVGAYSQKAFSEHVSNQPEIAAKHIDRISDPSVTDLREIYWFLNMHTLIVCADKFTEESANKLIGEWAQASTSTAYALCWDHILNGNPLKSPWISNAEYEIRQILHLRYPDFPDISFQALLEARLAARATKRHIVFVSPLLRPFLRHFNNTILAFALECLKGRNEPDSPYRNFAQAFEDYLPEFARALVPFTLFQYDYFSITSLPYVTHKCAANYRLTSAITEIQLRFILLHECGHIILGHCDLPKNGKRSSASIEAEADIFALEQLCGDAALWGRFSVDDVWLAYRLLFFYLVIESRTVGILGEERIASEAEFEERRSAVLKAFLRRYPLEEPNILEATCSGFLLSYKFALSKLGKPFLEHALLQLRKPIAKSREPWWQLAKRS